MMKISRPNSNRQIMEGRAYQSFITKNQDVIERVCGIFKRDPFFTYTTCQLKNLLCLDDEDEVNLEGILRIWTSSLTTYFANYGNLCQNKRNLNWVWLKNSRDFYPTDIVEAHYRQFNETDLEKQSTIHNSNHPKIFVVVLPQKETQILFCRNGKRKLKVDNGEEQKHNEFVKLICQKKIQMVQCDDPNKINQIHKLLEQ